MGKNQHKTPVSRGQGVGYSDYLKSYFMELRPNIFPFVSSHMLKASQRKSPSKTRTFSLEGPLGLEPRTPCLKGRCSNRLSYGPKNIQ